MQTFPNEYFDLLIAISIENGRLGKNQGGYFSQWNICENIGKCEKRKLLESSHASTIMMTARGFEEPPSINQGRWVFITIMMLLVISDQEFDDQHHQHDDDQHQVEELHCRHHPHKGHRGFHCHQLVRITSDCPGELAVGRGVRQLLLGQCSALSRSPW